MVSKSRSNISRHISKVGLQDILNESVLAPLEINHYEKNEVIITSGDKLDFFYIILEGKVEIASSSEKGNVVSVDYLEERGLLGDIEYFQKCNYLHNVFAAVPSKILVIPLEIMDSHLTKSAPFLMFMCSSITEKLITSSINNARTLLYPARNKLCKYILQKSEIVDSPSITFKNKEVARLLGLSERHISRLISELSKEKILYKQNKTVTILNNGKIREYSSYF